MSNIVVVKKIIRNSNLKNEQKRPPKIPSQNGHVQIDLSKMAFWSS